MRNTVELLLWWGLLLPSALLISRALSRLETAVGGCLAAVRALGTVGADGAVGAVAVRRASGAAVGGTAYRAQAIRAQALRALPRTLLGGTARLALAGASPRPRYGAFRSVRLPPASPRTVPARSTPGPGNPASPGAAPPSTDAPRPGTAGTP
ncbi:hypothetical protein J5Y04_06245 [Kitasatospora sp. RG8]|uniref:hypothetical protein n=1 Tax=Kitasatospora sp. RG8 TaxID=2820815 RepID=UPI001AE031C5|nr:hypothetical protein [Kitasatospora sp. RG8]MBP0449146.1 hypothetical protein [Kitasatospora sp. RG8]